jgi:SAM-dependent methyltransferase
MAAFFLMFQQGVVTGYDGGTMYEVTRSIVDRGTFAISDEWNTLPGPDGRAYGRYGLGLSLLGTVPYFLARPAAEAAGNDFITSAAVASLIPLISALLIVALYTLSRRMGAATGPSLIVAIGGVVGTFMLPYSKEFFSEPLTALFLVVAIERTLAGRPGMAGFALGLGVLTRPQTLLMAPVLLFVAWRRDGSAMALRASLGLLPGIALTFVYNVIRFGGPLMFGYQDVGFTTPLLLGLRGLFLEPTKSVLLFAPVVVLVPFALRHAWRHDLSAFVLITANLVITFVVTATWFAWHGGWSWGPRLLLPGLIPCFAALGPWLSTPGRVRTTLALLVVGAAVSLPAFVVSPEAIDAKTPPPSTHFLDTQPLASPSVVDQIGRVPDAARYSIQHPYEDRGDGLNRLRTLSLWQLGAMRALGRPGLFIGIAGTAMLLGVALFAAGRLRRAVHGEVRVDAGGVDDRSREVSAGTWNLEAMEVARNYNEFLTTAVLSRVDASRPVLDLGAGSGTHARRLRQRGLDVRCVEPDPRLRRLLEGDNFEVASDVRDLARGSFGSAYSLNVLEHIRDDEDVLRQLSEVLDRGGRLIIYVPAFPILFSSMDRRVGHVRRYRMRGLRDRVRDAGFHVVSCRYVDGLGFPAALAYRLLRRSGELRPGSVARYDSWLFPLSRALEPLTSRWVGKNLLLEARRD